MFHERHIPLTSPIKKYENNTFVAISADGTTIAIETVDNTVNTLHLTDNEVVIKYQELESGQHKFDRVLALSPDGQHLVIYVLDLSYRYQEEYIRLWDTQTGEIIQDYQWDVVFPAQVWNFHANIIHFQFLADGKQIAGMTDRGEVAVWSTSNGNLLRFIGQSSCFSNDIIMSHDGKWFISLEDNLDRSPHTDYRDVIPVGRFYEGDTDLYNFYGYQSRVCYNFERAGIPQVKRSSLPLGVIYLGRVEPVIFNVCDAYSGSQIRNLTFPMPENVMVNRGYKWHDRIAHDFQLSHDDSMLIANVDSNIFLWDVESGDISQIITRDESLKVIGFSTDDRFLICYDVNTVFVWDIKKQTWVGTHHIEGEITKAAISDTNRIAATVWNGEHWEIAVIDLLI